MCVYEKILLFVDINALFCAKTYLNKMKAIITGATKGIGKAIATKLAQSGYHLAVCARSEKDLIALQKELAQYPVKVHVFVADCSVKDQVLAFCEAAATALNGVDVLVNNVGVFLMDNLLDESDEVFEIQQQVNLNTTYYCSKYFGKIMRAQQHGHIFNICSVASKETIPNAGSYCVTKTAMLSLNNVLRKELAQYNVKVTAILPGSTLTASWEGTTIDPQKFVQPTDVAEAISAILNLSTGANVDELIVKPVNF